MKTIKMFFFALIVMGAPAITNAQTVDEIIANYFENTGGMENWKKVTSLKMSGVADAQGMQIPWEMYQTSDGKQALTIDLQGQKMTQMAFDGNEMWTTNFMTMQPEKGDAEMSSNMKSMSSKSFPSPFMNYKEKGFTVELVGEETMEGTDTYKVKLVQDPMMIDGVETANISYYFFDKENFVPIAMEAEAKQGPMKGQMMKDIMSDYQEVGGLYFPFSMTQGGQPLSVDAIEVNPEIDATIFNFPASTTEGEKK